MSTTCWEGTVGTIFPEEEKNCERCGCKITYLGVSDPPRECVLCKFLGDRSLVWLLRDPTPENIAAFRAAPRGSEIFNGRLRRLNIR